MFSLRLTAICVLDERSRVVLEGKVHSSPAAIADFLQPYAPTLKLAGLEAGLLAPYLYSGLLERGLPVVCIETRRMKGFCQSLASQNRPQGCPPHRAGDEGRPLSRRPRQNG
jgi:transposase